MSEAGDKASAYHFARQLEARGQFMEVSTHACTILYCTVLVVHGNMIFQIVRVRRVHRSSVSSHRNVWLMGICCSIIDRIESDGAVLINAPYLSFSELRSCDSI